MPSSTRKLAQNNTSLTEGNVQTQSADGCWRKTTANQLVLLLVTTILKGINASQIYLPPHTTTLDRSNIDGLLGIRPSGVPKIRDSSVDKLLTPSVQTSGTEGSKWLLLFYSTDSARQITKSRLALFQLGVWAHFMSQNHFPIVKLGIVDCGRHSDLCTRFGIVFQPELLYWEAGHSKTLEVTDAISGSTIQRLMDSLQTPARQPQVSQHTSPLGLMMLRVHRWLAVAAASYSKPSVWLGNLLLVSSLIFAWSLMRSLLGEGPTSHSGENKADQEHHSGEPSA